MPFRHAYRYLAQTPFLTAVIILSLAIGVGTNTVVFSWLKAAVLNPLPGVTAPVQLLETKDDTGTYVTTSWLEYQDLGGLLPSFSSIAIQRMRVLNLGDTVREARVYAELVSSNFFAVLGVAPQSGRFFHADEATQPGSAPVAVISYEFWQRNFEGAPDVIGRIFKLNGVTFTVIGVTPPEFQGGYNHLAFDVFLPATMAERLVPATSELKHRENRPYVMLAQLRPGVSPAQAKGELDAAAKYLIANHPDTNRGLGFELLPVWRSPRGGVTTVASLATLQIFAILILVVVCANTANLLLARASGRQREIGVRLALGAGPGRILRQLLGESVLLGLLGALGGILLSLWGTDLIRQLPLPAGLPIHLAPTVDGMSLVFAIGIAITCGLAFGLAPAWQLARSDVQTSLSGGRSSIQGRSRLRDILIGTEVAVALLVLVLAGLFLSSFRHALTASPGFDAGRVLLLGIDLGERGYDRRTGGTLLNDLLQRLEAMPHVAGVAAANYVPLDMRGLSTGVISIEGKNFDPNRRILYYAVSPGYFSTLGIPLLAGADLAPSQRADLPLDAVIDDEMARRYWPNANPVGHRFEVDGTTYVISGVARTPKLERMNEAPRPAAWLSIRNRFVSAPILHIRTNQGDPRTLLPAIREAIHQVDPGLALLDPRTLTQHIEGNLFIERIPAHLLAVLAPLALGLAAIGLYAVVAYSVALRTQEIGIRLALGATPQALVGCLVWQSMRVVLISGAVGWCLALAAGWYLQPKLVNVHLGDPLIYVGLPVLLLAVALFACWLPVQRASRVDPIEALRAE